MILHLATRARSETGDKTADHDEPGSGMTYDDDGIIIVDDDNQ